MPRRTQEGSNKPKRKTAISRCVVVVDGKKPCSRCNETLPVEHFYRCKRAYSGYREECKACKKTYDTSYSKKTRESRRIKKMAWRHANPDKVKRQRREYHKKRPEVALKKAAQYNAMKKQATPKWLTQEQKNEILEMYKIAKELSWLSESRLVVDHIIPLRGENVCGLHVPWNLQIIPESMNIKKGNAYEP